MANFKEVKDSGKRQEFKTGSVRDTAEGKGMPHLIAGEALAQALYYKESPKSIIEEIECLLLDYSRIIEYRNDLFIIYQAINLTIKLISDGEDQTYNAAMTRLAKHYENGAKKYEKNNWRKGQPISRYYDSAMRHLWKVKDNMTDEDHQAALLWNLIALVQTKIDIDNGLLSTELNDFPFIVEETFPLKEK
jgi:hypothetical protein